MRFLAGMLVGGMLASSVAVAGGGLTRIDAFRAEVAALQQLALRVPQEPLRHEMRWRLANLDARLVSLGAAPSLHPGAHVPGPWAPPAWGPPAQQGPGWAPGPWGPSAGCPEGDLSSLERAVSDAPFEADRLGVVRSAAAGCWFTTAQVIRLVRAVSFADARVEVAATLYPRVVDPERWYLVYDDIPFSSSREALRRRTR